MIFSGVINIDKTDVHTEGQGQRSKFKVTEVKTQLSRFRTATPVWIHDEMMQKAWCCLGEVSYYFSRSSIKFQGHTAKNNRCFFNQIGRFRTVTPVWIHLRLQNNTQSLK